MFKSAKAKLKQSWKSFRFYLSANENPLFMAFYSYFYHPKKGSLAEFLSFYSQSKPSDFHVIQIGANDGITNDPIHKFIKRDRWKGILLEPQPEVFEEFLSKIYAKNPEIHTLCAAIGREDGTQKLYKIGFSSMRWATGLATFSRQKLEENFKSGVVKSNCDKFGIQIPEDPSEQIKYEHVKVICPETLIKDFRIPQIDLLQIDAEGFDLEVIKIFEIEKTNPKAIIFENENLPKDELETCYQLLKNNGYKLQKFGRDTLAMKNPDESFARFFSN